MLISPVLCLVFAGYLYLNAFQSAMPIRRWTILGLLFGPLVLPLFWLHQSLNLRRQLGFADVWFKA
ncbi:hypothetical protein [Aliagarivorans marinus]|uniref:hypothetical protein n=1 Tax=Aliagarivorans marinus TaxID=561965 RepID=UPI0004216B93|nr:hypothetical protein [Aliagarivorans marinus]